MKQWVKGKFMMAVPCAVLSVTMTSAAHAQRSDESSIRAMVATYYKAFRERNVDKVMTLYWHSPKFIAFDVVPPVRYVGWNAYKKDWQNFFAGFKGPVTDQAITFHLTVDGSMAYSEATERLTGTLTNGQKTSIVLRATDVYQKIGGKWLIVHEHVSVPVDFITGKGVFDAGDH